MSAKGDARAEHQSSSHTSTGEPEPSAPGSWARRAGLACVLFVCLHLAFEAYRANSEGALPTAGFELQPWFVGIVLVLVWLPGVSFGARQWLQALRVRHAPSAGPDATLEQRQERALSLLEPLALSIALLFASLHGALMAWPLLNGAASPEDVRPELIAALSSTQRGVPLRAIVYLCAVGATSFYLTRLTGRAFSDARLKRAIVLGGVCVYLLGSYAVIRTASGSLLP